MRLKDLRWHILLCVVLIISYLAIAFCYYLPIRSKAEESMKVLAHEAILVESDLANEKLNSYYETFMVDPSVLETSFNQTGLQGKFENIDGNKIIFSQDNQFVFQSINTSYYFYFLNENGVCGRLSLSDLFETFEFDIYAYASGGSVYYTNTEFDGTLMNQLLGDNFKIGENLGEDKTFTQVYKVLDERGVISSVELFEGVYIATFIPITSPSNNSTDEITPRSSNTL